MKGSMSKNASAFYSYTRRTCHATVSCEKFIICKFSKSCEKLDDSFLSVYQTKHITPYMHLLVSHIPQFLDMYVTLAPFSQQGLEKLSDDLTKDYFRSTNHRDYDALKQMLLKLNRLEDLTDQDCHCPKQVHVCKLCKTAGHNDLKTLFHCEQVPSPRIN